MTDNTTNGDGLIPAQKAKIAAVEEQIRQLDQEIAGWAADLGRLQAEAETAPTPELLAKIDATAAMMRRRRAGLPRSAGQTPSPLQAERTREREALQRLRDERQRLAREIHRIEQVQVRYGDVLAELLEAAQVIRAGLDARGWPPHLDAQAVAKVWSWAERTQRELEALPTLRARLEAYGSDPERPLPDFEREGRQKLWRMAGLVSEPAPARG